MLVLCCTADRRIVKGLVKGTMISSSHELEVSLTYAKPALFHHDDVDPRCPTLSFTFSCSACVSGSGFRVYSLGLFERHIGDVAADRLGAA